MANNFMLNAFPMQNFGMPFQNFGGWNNTVFTPTVSSPKEETWEEALERYAKEAEKEKLQESGGSENGNKEIELTKKEQRVARKAILKREEKELKEAEGSLGSTMAMTSVFAAPTLMKMKNKNQKTIEMFYKEGAPHMELYKKNPDLMLEAQNAMQKLEKKFHKDAKLVKGNREALAKLAEERKFFRDTMEAALRSNNPKEIATATEQCKVASGVKNGRFARTFRKFRSPDNIIKNRFDATASAEAAGKFANVKPPKACTSFLGNLKKLGKIGGIMTAAMALIPIVTDWGKIQSAFASDSENKQNGKDTNYGWKQVGQTGAKGAASAITYTLFDVIGRTLTKKCLGKLAARLAAKIAVKGGCKILGTAIGSVVPGIGNVIGLALGCLADWALNKYVFDKMDFFKNSAATEGKVTAMNDTELVQEGYAYKYAHKEHMTKQQIDTLRNNVSKEEFEEMTRVRNMKEKERQEYFEQQQAEQMAQAQQEQAAQLQAMQAQQAQQTQQELAVA